MIRGLFRSSVVVFLLLFASLEPLHAQVKGDQQIKNLLSFAKLYGYTRFFHPSNESAYLDWDEFAVLGVEEVLKCKNNNEIKETLKRLFLPVAPAIRIYSNKNEPDNNGIVYSKDTTGMDVIAWQHFGTWLSSESNTYRSYRVFKNTSNISERGYSNLTEISRKPQTARLFSSFPKTGEVFEAQLGDSLFCSVPLTLYADSTGALGKNLDYPFVPLYEKLNLIGVKALKGSDLRVRLADVIIAWNVLQHFFPYFDVVKVDWEKVLPETLADAMKDKTADDFSYTLKKMVAKLQDGHGAVYYKMDKPEGRLQFFVSWIENNVVVTASTDPDFQKGDIIKTIDGKSGEEALLEIEKYVSGSPQLRRFRALNIFGQGALGSIADIDIIRNNETVNLKKERNASPGSLFFNKIAEFNGPSFRLLDKDIYYVNMRISVKEFYANINQLSKAKGIIFDWRWNGDLSESTNYVSPIEIVSLIADSIVNSAKWNIPTIIYPDRKELKFAESQWPVSPKQPHLKGKILFIDEPSVVSYGETCMGIVENSRLAETVGEATAGTNGNVNYISLPGGYRIMWTGMKVIKQDGSQHHLIGIQPTYPVKRTIKAAKEGRDEYLEKAIEVIKSKIK